MTHIPYIYIVKENGFIEETKLLQDIDLSTLKQGDNITSFYDETYPLFNIYFKNDNNESAMFDNGQLIFINQENIEEKIKANFLLLINQVASSKAPNLLNDYKSFNGSDRPSIFKEYLDNFSWKTQYEINPLVEDFSLDKYQNIVNELHFLCDRFDNKISLLGHFVKGSIRGFNTFLAYDEVISDFSSGLFSSSHNNENNKAEISFSDASQALCYANDICNGTIHIGIKKERKLKL